MVNNVFFGSKGYKRNLINLVKVSLFKYVYFSINIAVNFMFIILMLALLMCAIKAVSYKLA